MARSYRSVGSSWAPSFRNHSSKIHHRQLTQVDIEDTYLPSGKIFYWKAILFLECQNNLRKSGFMVNFSGSNYALRKCIDGFVLIRLYLVGSLIWDLTRNFRIDRDSYFFISRYCDFTMTT